MRHTHVATTVAAVTGLWAFGRYRRSTWTLTPTVQLTPCEGLSRTAIFVLTGAFNGPEHTERLIEEYWRHRGDVYAFGHPDRRFDLTEMIVAVLSHLDSEQYDRIVLDGYSLGGLVCLNVLEWAWRDDPELAAKLELIINDTPLGPQHLFIPGGKAVPERVMSYWLRAASTLQHVHVGPLFNMVSPLVTKAFFIPMDEKDWEPGTDRDQLKRHMAFLRANKLSVIIEQIAAIRPFKPRRKLPNKITYLRCANDVVVDGQAAYEELKQYCSNLRLIEVGAGTSHVAIVEGHEAWMMARRQAFESAA